MEGGKVRIHVGGLGEKVTGEELKKLVSASLGEIQAVEIVNSKGRYFAYMDFLPSSSSSLSKLFSTYNGCIWKGGRLRLEKAKEHYLARVQREWAEDSELAKSASSAEAVLDSGENVASLNRPKKDLSPEKAKLKIFFPRLRKVKSIPFSGTGKHKYSFRRVEVPSLSKYFCDCEEHSSPPHTSRCRPSSTLEEQGVGMNEDEINIMNSVMNKLFTRENISQFISGRIDVNDERDNSAQVIDGVPEEDKADYLASDEEDNLIINVKARGQETGFSEEVSKLKEQSVVKGGPTKDVVAKQRRDDAAPDKKRIVVFHENNGANVSISSFSLGEDISRASSSAQVSTAPDVEPGSRGKLSSLSSLRSKKPSWKELVGHGSNDAFKISDILPGAVSCKEEQSKPADEPISGDSEDEKFLSGEDQNGPLPNAVLPEHLSETQTSEPESRANTSDRGSAWLHPSSWTQLIGGSSSNTFSITQMLPGIAFEEQEPGELEHRAVTNSTHNSSDVLGEGKSEAIADSLTSNNVNDIIGDGIREATTDGVGVLAVGEENKVQNAHNKSHEVTRPNYELNGNAQTSKPGTEDAAIGETCLFMRTAASLKEWAKAKAALTASHKRKRRAMV